MAVAKFNFPYATPGLKIGAVTSCEHWNMSTPLIFIDGDQGTTGLQIHQRLRHRTDLQLLRLDPRFRKDPQHRAEAINACDLAILCLPDDAAREAVASIHNPSVRVIDASSAHRTQAGWTYGFAEMGSAQAQAIRTAKRVSNPGCYPTGAIGLLRPLLQAGLLPANYPVSINAVSGYSGKGRAGVDEYEGENATQAPPFQVYGLGLSHKHVPEIAQHSGLLHRPVFVPAYGAFRQGIVLTIPLQLHLLKATAQQLHQCLADHYAGQRHVSVMPLADSKALSLLDPQLLNGTDDLRLMVFEHGQQVLLAAVFDNLGKGAAGAAVQNLNLMINPAP